MHPNDGKDICPFGVLMGSGLNSPMGAGGGQYFCNYGPCLDRSPWEGSSLLVRRGFVEQEKPGMFLDMDPHQSLQFWQQRMESIPSIPGRLEELVWQSAFRATPSHPKTKLCRWKTCRRLDHRSFLLHLPSIIQLVDPRPSDLVICV